jgi:hypothetical protein
LAKRGCDLPDPLAAISPLTACNSSRCGSQETLF